MLRCNVRASWQMVRQRLLSLASCRKDACLTSGSVAVRHITCVPFCVISISLSISRRYFSVDSMSMWHLLITMRLKWRSVRILSTKQLNKGKTAPLGVTSTMLTLYAGCVPS